MSPRFRATVPAVLVYARWLRRQGRLSRYQLAKVERTVEYHRYLKRRGVCVACNGSGHYDDGGSPRCSSCKGKGVETLQEPTDWASFVLAMRRTRAGKWLQLWT